MRISRIRLGIPTSSGSIPILAYHYNQNLGQQMQILKADTVTEVTIGPVVAVGDGFTPVTTLTIAGADEAEIIKHGATTNTSITGTLAAITNADGYYSLDLVTGDVNTEGRLTILINDDSLCLPVRHDFMVVNANVFDSLYAADTTDYLKTDTFQIASTTQDATDLADFAAAGYDPGTNKVQGVVLVDTTTDTTNLHASAATAANLATVDTVVDGIQTDLSNATDGLGAIKTSVDAIPTTAMRGTDSAALATVCTEARLAELDAANLPADVDAILVDTGTTLDDKLNDIQGATFVTSTDSLEAIRDRGDAAWTTGAGGADKLVLQDTTIATLATQTSFTLTAGSTDDDAYNNCTIVIEDVATSTQKALGMVLDYVGSTKTITLKEALAFTIATTDKIYILAENSLKSTVANRQLDITETGAAGIDWGNVENKTTANDLSATDIQLVDTVTIDSTSVDLIYDEPLSGHNVGGSAGKALRQIKEGTVSIESTINDGAATTTSFITALTEATSSHYKDTSLVFIDGALIGQSRPIFAYNGTTKTITLDEALTEAPSNGDGFIIKTDHVHTITEIQAGLATEAKQDIIDANVDQIETAVITNASGVDIAADIIAVKAETAGIIVDTAEIGTAGAGLTDLGGMSTGMKAEINVEADTALTDYDPPTNSEMEARTPTATQLAYIVANAATAVPVTFTTAGGSTTTAVLNLVDGNAASNTNDQYNGRLLVFGNGSLEDAVTDITDYVGSTNTATITAIPTAPTSSHNARLI